MKNLKCFILLLFTIVVKAQQNQVHFPTPANVWEFTKYGNVPVSEYRGLANINIPMHNVTVDDISIPIELNYYSGGIRVSEEGGVVGLGWSMNMPTIVQQIKNKNDYKLGALFQKLPPFQGNPALPGDALCPTTRFPYWTRDPDSYYQLPGVQDVPYYTQVANAKIIDHNGYYNVNGREDYKYLDMLENYRIDTEPDIFTVNLNGIEIKFCRVQTNIPYNGQPQIDQVLPVEIINSRIEYKIELILNTLPYQNGIQNLSINGFKITDPSNNVYFFTKIEKENSPQSYINYKLSKIITNKSKEIIFNYSSAILVTETNKTSARYVTNNGNTSTTYILGTAVANPITNVLDSYPLMYEYAALESIVTPSSIISFNYSGRLDIASMIKLDSFHIRNIFNQKVDEFLFNYDYFVSNDNGTKRLKLLSVTEVGNNPYIFEYNSLQLPKKDSYSIDYWGFYNGHNNLNLSPDLTDLGYPQHTQSINNDFNSKINYAKACTLEKIIYPTKGYTIFNYDLHQFDNLNYYAGSLTPIINIGAGLRLKSITNYNFDNNIVNKKEYKYFGGKCINKRVLTKQCMNIIIPSGTTNTQIIHEATPVIIATLNNFLNSTINSEGDYIGYDNVEIKNVGITDNGKVDKKFVNIENRCINPYSIMSTDAYYYSNKSDFENGKILEEKTYNATGEILLKLKYNYFNRLGGANFYGMSIQSNGVRHFSELENGGYSHTYFPITLATFYPIFGKTTFMSGKETTEYFNGVAKTITTKYNLDNRGNIVDLIEQEYNSIYPNRDIISESSGYTFYNNLSIKSRKEAGIIKEIQRFSYEQIPNSERLKKIEIFPNGNLNLANKNFSYDVYDDNNNLNQYHNERNINVCVIWGYKKTLPIAKIENITFAQIQAYINTIQVASNTNDESSLLNALATFRTTINAQFPDALVTTYTHKPLIGISTITDIKADKVTYSYDGFGKLINVRDKNNNILTENEYHFKL